MKKAIFIKTTALLFFLSSMFVSCSFFNEPIKEYFKEYTETSSVVQYEISSNDILTDNTGTLCVPSYKDIEITFYMINPQRFIFSNGNNMILSFPNLNMEGFSETEKEAINILLKSITITQNKTDSTILHMTYPAEFLAAAETGLEISPSIQLFHPVSHTDFGTFMPLVVKSNSPPPQIYCAVIYKDAVNGTYVVCLNMPSKGMLKGIHRDIKTITIENTTLGKKTTSPVMLNEDGTFSFADSSFSTGEPDSSLSPSGAEFSVYGQPATFKTGDKFSDQNTQYIITLTDSAGLSSNVATSVYSIKLGEISVTDKNGNKVEAGNEIQQDEGSSYATLTFTPAQTTKDEHTGEIKNTSDSQIVYEIYQGTDDTGKILYNGKNSGGAISLKIPAGNIFCRVYAHKDLFTDSKPAEFGIKVLKSTLFVSPDGNDTENNGSENSPYATISKAIAEFSDITVQNRINLLGNITQPGEIIISEPDANITINGSTSNGNNFGFTGNISSAGNLTIKDSLVNGTIDTTRMLILSDSTVNGSVKTGGELALYGKSSVTSGITFENSGLFITYDPAGNPAENVAKINFAENTVYEQNDIILKPAEGKTLTQEDCNRFTLSMINFIIKVNDYGTAGYLTESKIDVSSELSGVRFIPTTSLIYFSKVQAGGQKVSFSVQKKTADSTSITYTDVTPSSAKIALYQNGSELTNHSVEASNNLPELTLASWLPEGKYNLYMSATVDGVEYSAWETFVITSKIPISSLTSAPDSRYFPHLAAETGEDLKKLNEWMQDGSTMEGITITLTEDIDLTSETEWQPIGTPGWESDTDVPFKGTINGNGNTIKLEISSGAQACLGLVKINEGIIENLVIEQYSQDGITFGDISARGSRGGAICVNNRGIIRNCVNKANLKAYTFWGVAGICMVNYGTVENCLNTGNIQMVNTQVWAGEWIYSSGIAAENFGSIINCVNTGKIIAQELQYEDTYVNNFSGAITGRLYNTEDTTADISNCYWLENSVTRNGTDVNECVTIVVRDITYEGSAIHVDSIPDPSKITGCGYFNDFSASAPLTAGDEASCKTAQTLSYGTTLLEALNGYVSANSGRELKQWQASADGSITIGF